MRSRARDDRQALLSSGSPHAMAFCARDQVRWSSKAGLPTTGAPAAAAPHAPAPPAPAAPAPAAAAPSSAPVASSSAGVGPALAELDALLSTKVPALTQASAGLAPEVSSALPCTRQRALTAPASARSGADLRGAARRVVPQVQTAVGHYASALKETRGVLVAASRTKVTQRTPALATAPGLQQAAHRPVHAPPPLACPSRPPFRRFLVVMPGSSPCCVLRCPATCAGRRRTWRACSSC